MTTDIFRKVSLARLSSPEQLDLMLRVTTPRTWIALAALLLVLGAAAVWGFAGSIATKADGQGVVIRSGHVTNVATLGAGRLLDVQVKVGDLVKANQVIATVAQPALLEKIRIAQAQIEDASGERSRVQSVRSQAVVLQLESIKRQRANYEQEIEDLAVQRRLVTEQVPVDEELLSKGLITKQQVIGTKQKLTMLEGQMSRLRTQLTQLNSTQYQAENEGVKGDLDYQNRIVDLKRNLGALKKELDFAYQVISPYSGQVLEVKVAPGALVSPGTAVISVQPEAKELEAVVYISARKAKGIQVGMDVELSPTIVKREEYGFIRAQVTYVAEYPSTEEALMRIFENNMLARSLAGEGPVTEVRVRMLEDRSTPSGYKWSSSTGAPVKITGGMLCSAQVVTRQQRPISLVFPTIKETLGLS